MISLVVPVPTKTAHSGVPATSIDRGAERGARQPTFRPRTARHGSAATAGDGLNRGRERGVARPTTVTDRGRRVPKDAAGANATLGLDGRTGRLTPRPRRPKSSAEMFAVRGQVNALAVAVLAGGGRGVVAVRENVPRDAGVRKANARAVAAQEMFRWPWPCGRCSLWP